jgi:Na+/H+ antiporter NhaA
MSEPPTAETLGLGEELTMSTTDAGEHASQTGSSRRDLVAQLSVPLRQFLSTEAAGAVAMLAATVSALVWANSPWAAQYEALQQLEVGVGLGAHSWSTTFLHAVNDGLLAVFFFVIGLEVRRELSIGELTRRRRAVLPAVAGVAGLTLPVVLFSLLAPRGEAAGAWGMVLGTDTAFLLGALALVGPKVATQLRVFLLTVTVVDDVVAVAVIGLVYSGPIRQIMLVPAAASVVALVALNRLHVWRVGPYVVVAAALWCATVRAGLHASLAGMVAGLSVAAHTPRPAVVEGAISVFRAFRQSPMAAAGRSVRRGISQALSVNERLQASLHPWTSFVIVPAFAFANAGVDLRGGRLEQALRSPLTWTVVISLVLGKLVGVGGVALLGPRLGLGPLPRGVGPGHVLGGAALSGIGFTVSLLVADLAFTDPVLKGEATVGVLVAAVVSTLNGKVVFWSAAVLHGEGDADLPRLLDRPVEVGVDHIRGPVDAPLTLVEYGDFECPFCARATGVAADLRARFGPELRYVFRHLPLTAVHPHAELAARAALAADRQGQFWAMHDTLFAHQDQLEIEDLLGYAADLDLDVEEFARAIEDPQIAQRIRADLLSAEASGARGTPTFFVCDRRHVGPYDAETLTSELLASAAGRLPDGLTGGS